MFNILFQKRNWVVPKSPVKTGLTWNVKQPRKTKREATIAFLMIIIQVNRKKEVRNIHPHHQRIGD